MKTRIVSTRIPTGQANGSFDINLPEGFGVPKGFLVYAMDNAVQPNNFDSTTTFPCLSVGFGGSNIAGTGLTNVCFWVSNQDGADPSSSLASFGNTVSVFSRNIANTVFRQWQMTGFGNNIIFGTYTAGGTQVQPIDLVFTVFGGDDFFCAVGQTGLPAAINSSMRVATTFQPDAILYSHLRPLQTADSLIHFGTALRNASTGATFVSSQLGGIWRSTTASDPTVVRARISNTGSLNLASTSTVLFQYMFQSGFAVTQSSANAGHSIMYMAMKAGVGLSTNPAFAADTFQSRPTASGTGISFYAVGFKPSHIIGNFSHLNALNSTPTDAASGCEMLSFFTANGFQQSNINGIGTINSSTSSATITGTGTSFLQQLCPLDKIYNLEYQLIGTVSSISSNTSLSLTGNAAITVTGSSFVFEKPQQFSFSYGNENNVNSGSNMRGRVSDSAITSFTATTPTLQAVGNIQNFDGQNGFTVNYTTLANGARFGWYLAIRDEDFYTRRRGGIS
jgi:hypothetical protein